MGMLMDYELSTNESGQTILVITTPGMGTDPLIWEGESIRVKDDTLHKINNLENLFKITFHFNMPELISGGGITPVSLYQYSFLQ